MSIERGDVFNTRFPHASGDRGKKRPVVVVQANLYNQRLRHAVVAQITTNLLDNDDAACVLIEAGSPDAQAAGILRDSVVSGYLLTLMTEDRLQHKIGHLSDSTMQQVSHAVRAALGLA